MVHLMLTELKAEQYALKQGLNSQFRCTVGDMHLTRHTSTGQFLATQQLIRGTSGEMFIQSGRLLCKSTVSMKAYMEVKVTIHGDLTINRSGGKKT